VQTEHFSPRVQNFRRRSGFCANRPARRQPLCMWMGSSCIRAPEGYQCSGSSTGAGANPASGRTGAGTNAPAAPVRPHGSWGLAGRKGVTVGIGRRLAELYEIKVNALLNRAEDPREVLDYSYARQQELLLRIRRAAADVAAARTRAGMQEHQLRRAAARLQRQARQAAAAGQDELARQALTLRTATLAQVRDLRAEQAALRADEERLSAAASRLQAQISGLAAHKEALKAQYTAAQAAAGASQAFGGVWEQMGEVDLATRRAEDTIARLQARASALDDLITSGTAPDLTVLAGDDEIQAQLDALTTRAVVDEELAKIKDQLASEANPATRKPGRGHRPATARTRREPGGPDRRGS